MYLDKMTEFEPGTTLRLDTTISENVVDNGAPAGSYQPHGFLVIKVTAAFNTATAIQADLVSDDAETLDSAPVVHASTGLLTLAGGSWALGSMIIIPIGFPTNGQGTKRYMGLKWTRTGTANTTGKVKAWIAADVRMTGLVNNSGGTAAIPVSRS